MTEQTKENSGSPLEPGAPFCPHYLQESFWSPLRSWCLKTSTSRLLPNQEFGLPAFLEVGDLRDLYWLDNIHRRLTASIWPGYLPSLSFLVPSYLASASVQQSGPRLSRAESAGLQGVSEVRIDGYKWRISLDVSHFAPTEITLRTQGGFLEVEGKHEERPDEHGFIARCFTRRYTLPVGIDVGTICSSLYGDGILSVEALLTDPSVPADIEIPIQLETKTVKEEEGGTRTEDSTEADKEASDPQPFASVPDVTPVPLEAPDYTPTEHGAQPPEQAPEPGDEVSQRIPGEEAHPEAHLDSSATGPERHEEGRAEADEKTITEPAGVMGSQPSGSAADEAREGDALPTPKEPFEHDKTSESPDTVTSKQGGHLEPEHGHEWDHLEGTAKQVEDVPQFEEPEPGISAAEEVISAPEEGAHFPELKVLEQSDTEQSEQEHIK